MKIKFHLVPMLSLVLLLSQVSFTANAQKVKKPIADTGIVMLGPNQVLRLTVATGDVNNDGAVIQFRQLAYMPVGCSGEICKHTINAQSTSTPVMLMRGEAASLDIESYGSGVRALVISDDPNVRVNAMIVDKTTNNIIGVLIA